MASIGKDPNGYRRILFVAPDGKRKTIRLGRVSQKTAEGVKMSNRPRSGAAGEKCRRNQGRNDSS